MQGRAGWSSSPPSAIPEGSPRRRGDAGRYRVGSVARPTRIVPPITSWPDLAGRSLVVVLDDCEQVIDQAARVADTLVVAVPGPG